MSNMAENIPPSSNTHAANASFATSDGVTREHIEISPSLIHPSRIADSYDRNVAGTHDSRRNGCTWTKVKVDEDHPDRHELFLLGDGEKKVEVEAVTRKLRLLALVDITDLH